MNTQRNWNRSGFTLMEIMVVIIVIAVLASVAGPMIGSITDQGKASATRAAMQNVKTALVNYNNDLGKFPFVWADGTSAQTPLQYNLADIQLLGDSEGQNVLVNGETLMTDTTQANLGIKNDVYTKRWKGPYMDSDPSEFMVDAWESKITYCHYNKALYLFSNGPDGVNDQGVNLFNTSNTDCDDIVMSLTRLKF
jgi:prepilin-type N-terminal cleavage/methylation domain-containing protein